MPSSWSSFLCAARRTPATAASSCAPVSPGTPRGCEQHVLVHMSVQRLHQHPCVLRLAATESQICSPGNVIFSVARCWSRRRFCESKRKTENARCSNPLSIFSIKWPGKGIWLGAICKVFAIDSRPTNFLARAPDRLVVLVEDYAHLVHQTYLLLIVALQIVMLIVGAV